MATNLVAEHNTHLWSHSSLGQRSRWAYLGSLLGISWGGNQGVGQAGLDLEARFLKGGSTFRIIQVLVKIQVLEGLRSHFFFFFGAHSQLLEAVLISYPWVPFHLWAFSCHLLGESPCFYRTYLIRSGPCGSFPYLEVTCAIYHGCNVTSPQSKIHLPYEYGPRDDARRVYQGVEKSQIFYNSAYPRDINKEFYLEKPWRTGSKPMWNTPEVSPKHLETLEKGQRWTIPEVLMPLYFRYWC